LRRCLLLDGCVGVLDQPRRSVTKVQAFPFALPVAFDAPPTGLAWVALSGPAGELVVEGVVQDLEIALGDAVLVVVGPALDHRIEGVDETCLRRTAMLLDAGPQLVSMALQPLATGFDDGLVTGFAPGRGAANRRFFDVMGVGAETWV
jgi:hypothetical protein